MEDHIMVDLSLYNTVLSTFQNSSLHSKIAISYFKEKWKHWSYLELISSTNVVSMAVKKCINNDIGQFVVLFLNVTQTLVPLILGVLSASCAFVCLDSKLEIFKELIEMLKVQFIITNVDMDNSNFEKAFISETFHIFGEKITIWNVGIKFTNEVEVLEKKSIFAYAVKTSGTTGAPKVIKVTHNSIVPNIVCLSKIFNIVENDVIYLSSPITFDPSIIEMFLALSNGATLCIIDNKLKLISHSLVNLLSSESGPTFIQTTPSIFRSWQIKKIRSKLFTPESRLRILVLGGECFPTINELISWEIPEFITVYNIYGLTEISCWATINKVWPSKDIPDISIGEPLSETLIKFEKNLDTNTLQMFIGSSTRICLVNDERLPTADKLPFFRATGDLFEETNNKYYYLGRVDDKIKRWGVSIHLSDIENVTKNLGFANCFCLSDRNNYSNEEIVLALFIFLEDSTDIHIDTFRKNLKTQLNVNSWPDEIIFLNHFPLNIHGKIDRQYLIKLLREKTVFSEKPEDYFKKFWKHFTRSEWAPDKSFTASGGDSFTALQFIASLKRYSVSENLLGLLLSGASFSDCWKEFHETNDSTSSMMYGKKIKLSYEPIQNTSEKEVFNYENTNILYKCLKGNIFKSPNYSVAKKLDISQKSFKIDWKYELGKCIDASPLVIVLKSGESLAIIGSHSGIVAVLNTDNGDLISRCVLKDRIESCACVSDCGKHYYIGCYDGCLYKVIIESGHIVWSYPTGDLVKSTCALYGESVIFGSYDKHVYKVDKAGMLEWKCNVHGAVLAEVLIQNKKVYVTTLSSKFHILDISTGIKLHKISLSAPIFSSPRIVEDCILIAAVDGFIYWNSLENGEQINLYKSHGKIFSSVISVKVLELEYTITGSDDNLICLKQKQLYWSTKLDSNIIATPVLVNASNAKKFIVTVSCRGTLYLVDFSNGSICKQFKLPNDVFSSPAILNNTIVIGCRDDNVYCLSL